MKKLLLAVHQLVQDGNKLCLGSTRADGCKFPPMFLPKTKTPAKSQREWDLFKPVGVVPVNQAFRPLASG